MARRRRYSGGYGSGYQDPEDSMAQGGAFYNPYSPGIDWGMGIRNTLQNLAGVMEKRRQEKKEDKQQEFENQLEIRKQEADESRQRDLSEYYRAQSAALLAKKDAPSKVFSMSPVALQSFAKELKLPQEVVDNVSSMTPEAQEDFFNKSMDAIRQINLEKIKQAGPTAQAATERARGDKIKRQLGRITAATSFIQGLRMPIMKQMEAIDKSPMVLDKDVAKAPLQAQLDNIETAAGEIAGYAYSLGQGNDLPDESLKKIELYLSNPKKVKSGEIWENPEAQTGGAIPAAPAGPPELETAIHEIMKRRPGISRKDAEILAAKYLSGK